MRNNFKLLKDVVRQSSTKSLQPKGLLEWELRTPTHSWNLDGGNVSYTSLRDVMSSVLGKCKQGSLHHDIVCSRTPIKNRLVEQAARAYLQPAMVEHTTRNQYLTRQWQRFIYNTFIPSNFKDTFRRPIEACACLFSGLNLLDLSHAMRCLLGRLRPKVNGLLKA